MIDALTKKKEKEQQWKIETDKRRKRVIERMLPQEIIRKKRDGEVLTEEEIAELDGFSDEARGARGKLIFSAKECAYKCQYAVSSTFYGFMGMRVDIDAEPGATAGAFRATFLRDAGPFRPGDVVAGRFARRGGYVMTGAILR